MREALEVRGIPTESIVIHHSLVVSTEKFSLVSSRNKKVHCFMMTPELSENIEVSYICCFGCVQKYFLKGTNWYARLSAKMQMLLRTDCLKEFILTFLSVVTLGS